MLYVAFQQRVKHFPVLFLLVLLTAAVLNCGGDGNGEDFESFRNLNGAWVGPCRPKGEDFAREKFVFYEQTVEVAYIIEEFETDDCSDTGANAVKLRGSYIIGDEIECLSGVSGKCSELEVAFDNGRTYYYLYSIDGGEDPHELYFSEPSDDLASRSDDVQIINMYTRIILQHYLDSDGDGYGDPDEGVVSATPPSGYVLSNTDCDDTNQEINPGAQEIADDGTDQNCNGIDTVWYADTDDDGYGNPDMTYESETQPEGYVSDNTDPDDTDPDVFPRLVIVEIATGTWCFFCPGAAMGADDLMENGHRVGVINYHNGDAYETVESVARISYYAISGYPTAEFDGVLDQVGGSADSSLYTTYLPKYETRAPIQPKFSIAAQYTHTGGNNYRLTVETKQNGTYPSGNPDLVLQAVLTESHLSEAWQGLDALNFVCRDMIPDQNGTALDFTSSSTQSVVLDFTIPPEYVAENLELIVFIQDNDTKEILQGAIAR